MDGYRLQPFEGLVLRSDKALLTTHGLIWKQKRLFKKEYIVCPLQEIRVADGVVQAFLGGEKGKRRLEVYLLNGEQASVEVADRRKWDSDQRREVAKWQRAIARAITGNEMAYPNDGSASGIGEIVGGVLADAAAITRSVTDTLRNGQGRGGRP